ncbi:hypothetical protein [Sphingomonas sp. OK281]|uniref:hypothetical protein n=1 Tax=Sphingomonas sp. OK281 TaxID=1881067 RepID=UPI001113BC48|nr:hypothetical protein [Sphingomonas sp. OK281]
MAQRMLSASRAIANALPTGFHNPTALDVLLILHVAEDDANYPVWEAMEVPGSPSTMTIDRWLIALTHEGLVDRQNGLIALSQKGYALVVSTIERVYEAQRALD